MKEEASKVKGVLAPSAGTASSSSTQQWSPVPFTGFGTSRAAALDVSGIISQETINFCLALADLWRLTGCFDRSWGRVPDTLQRVPPLFQPIMSKVRVGRSQHLTWDALCSALRTNDFYDERQDCGHHGSSSGRTDQGWGLAGSFCAGLQAICQRDMCSGSEVVYKFSACHCCHNEHPFFQVRFRNAHSLSMASGACSLDQVGTAVCSCAVQVPPHHQAPGGGWVAPGPIQACGV